MTSDPIRDPQSDHLLTPANSAVVIIDYQPIQVNSIASMDRPLLVTHVVTLAKLAVGYGLPIVHSTVNVETGWNKPAIPPLREVLADYPTYDRTSINAWEDRDFREAVKATGRKKIILAGLWTEACLTFPALDMLREGFEVYPVTDAVGGTSVETHKQALKRVGQAGAQPVTVNQLITEMQRDWNRAETVELQIDLFLGNAGTPGVQMMYDRATAAPAS